MLAYLEGYEERGRELAVIDAQVAEARVALQHEKEDEAAALEEIDREPRGRTGSRPVEDRELRLRVGLIEKE